MKRISQGKFRILEVGCGEGLSGLELKRSGQASEVIGIELDPEAAKQAMARLDHVLCGDVEMILHKNSILAPESFDYILCGDVLEHLKDPWLQVKRLRGLLKPGGKIIATLPNVRYWKVSTGLLFSGKWAYVDRGILDRTHLRFFVRETVISLFERNGLAIEYFEPQGAGREYGYISWLLNMLTFGLLTDLLSTKYLVVASKVE